MTARTERRRTPRARTPAGMRLRLPGLLDTADVTDLSSSGVRCTTARAVSLLSLVEVTLLLPADGATREVVCTGAVVRSSRAPAGDPSGAGVWDTAIFFTNLDDDDRAKLDAYVASLRRAGQVA